MDIDIILIVVIIAIAGGRGPRALGRQHAAVALYY